MTKLNVRIFRHGAKKPVGTLSELGERQACEYGRKLSIGGNAQVQIYSSSKQRVLETTKIAVSCCKYIGNDINIEVDKALSINAVLYDSKKSDFFHKFSNYPVNTPEKVYEMEKERMDYWLSFKQQPDAGTASPRQVFNGLVDFFKRSAEKINLRSGSSKQENIFLCGTHEFMIAALAHFLIGNTLMAKIDRIQYLEDMDISIDPENLEIMSVTFRKNNHKVKYNL